MQLARPAVLALAVLGMAGAVSCSSADASVPATTAASADLGTVTIALSSGALVPEFSPDVHEYEVDAFGSLFDTTITVGGRAAHVLDFDTEPGMAHALPKIGITKDATLTVTVDGAAGDDPAVYTIKLLPADFPSFTFSSDSPEPGRVLLTGFPFLGTLDQTYPGRYLMMVSTAGEVVYYARKADTQVMDLKRQVLSDGTAYLTWIGYGGAAHVCHEDMTPVKDYSILATARHEAHAVDNHDIKLLGPDHVLLVAYLRETVTNIPSDIPQTEGGTHVSSALIQEIDQGRVVFEWDSTDHPELYALSTEGNAFTNAATYADYAHLNSVVVNPSNGNLDVSFRHLDAVLEISRTDGSIVWRLGGADDSFGTPAAQRSSHQHFASWLEDGRLMLYDNGNASGASRILTYGLDLANRAITSFEEKPLGYFSQFMGSTQHVGTGSQLVGLGSNPPGSPDVLLFERASGKETFRLAFDKDDYYSYRAHWLDGTGR